MNPWIALPNDVLDFVSAAFSTANEEATKRLVNVPNVREGSLDDAFVEALIPNSAPTVLPSGTTIKMDIHNIGGLRRAGSWETANIGVIVYVFRRELLICRKIGLLQSKRLYPKNNDVDDKGVGWLLLRNECVSEARREVAIRRATLNVRFRRAMHLR
jgi:hypothetical protein